MAVARYHKISNDKADPAKAKYIWSPINNNTYQVDVYYAANELPLDPCAVKYDFGGSTRIKEIIKHTPKGKIYADFHDTEKQKEISVTERHVPCNKKAVKVEDSVIEIYKDKTAGKPLENTSENLKIDPLTDTVHYEAYINTKYDSPEIKDQITKYMIDFHIVDDVSHISTSSTDIFKDDGNTDFIYDWI